MGYPSVDDEYAGRYRIVRRIGYGGMGAVFEAVDKVLNRAVAIKVVLPSLPDRDDYHERFAREASVLARIRSRNIVQIHEYGEDGDTVYFVTELFPDGDLRSWLADHGPLERRAALSLVAQLCEALADAHDIGVVHRDVKPGNVLVWHRGGTLIPYLCDFGIAVEGRAEDRQGLTRTGTMVGSPAYMAPERHFGKPADEAGDIYSMGCVLWACLTAEAPYAGTDFEIISAHVSGAPPQLQTGHPIDERIDELLREVLDKDPERRIRSAVGLRDRIQSLLDDSEGFESADFPDIARPEVAVAGSEETVLGPRVRAAGRSAADPGDPESTALRHVATVAASTTAAEPPAQGWSGRSRVLMAAVVVAVLAVAGGVAAAGIGGGGEAVEQAPKAGPSASSPVLAPPGRALVTRPRPGYRTVLFSAEPGRAAPGSPAAAAVFVEVDRGDGWQVLRDDLRESVREGGDRICVRLRTSITLDARTVGGPPSRVCASALPRTVTLIRSPDPCFKSGYTCTYYDVVATGFASGSSPLAEVRPVADRPWCDDPVYRTKACKKIRIGRDGRGRIDHYFAIAEDSGVVRVWMDGVRSNALRLT